MEDIRTPPKAEGIEEGRTTLNAGEIEERRTPLKDGGIEETTPLKAENERRKSISPLDSAKKTVGRIMRQASNYLGIPSATASWKNYEPVGEEPSPIGSYEDARNLTPLLGACSIESDEEDSVDVEVSRGARRKIYPELVSPKNFASRENDMGETSLKLPGTFPMLSGPFQQMPRPKPSSKKLKYEKLKSGKKSSKDGVDVFRAKKPKKLVPQPPENIISEPEEGNPFEDYNELTYHNGVLVYCSKPGNPPTPHPPYHANNQPRY